MGATENNNYNISRQFLQNALGDELEISEHKVTSGTKPGDNFMSLIYAADVKGKTKKGDEVTKHLLLKCYPVHPTRQEFNNKVNIFFKELEIYRLWMPELRRFQTEVIGLKEAIKLPYAPFVSGKCIDFASLKEDLRGNLTDPLENHIIMEDIRKAGGFRMTNRREPMDLDHIKLVVYELAKIHALSWAYKCQVEKDVCVKFPFLKAGFTTDDMAMFEGVAKANIDQAVGTIDEAMGTDNPLSKALKGFKKLVQPVFQVSLGARDEKDLDDMLRVRNDGKFGKDAENPVPWRVISHGDCWSNNMLFRYDEKTKKPLEVVLVDLQMTTETCIMPDLTYAIYSATDAKLRKNHLEELMVLYVDSFIGFCDTLKTETLSGFNLNSFKHRFHRYKLFGLQMALSLYPIMLKEDQDAQALNLENMDVKKDMSDLFNDVLKVCGANMVYRDRLIGLIQEMYDDGVI